MQVGPFESLHPSDARHSGCTAMAPRMALGDRPTAQGPYMEILEILLVEVPHYAICALFPLGGVQSSLRDTHPLKEQNPYDTLSGHQKDPTTWRWSPSSFRRVRHPLPRHFRIGGGHQGGGDDAAQPQISIPGFDRRCDED